MVICAETKLADIFSFPPFVAMKGQFIASANDWFAGGRDQLSLRELENQQKTWAAQDMVYGLDRLQEIASKCDQYVFPISEISSARLIWLPADIKKTETVCLLLAGGGLINRHINK